MNTYERIKELCESRKIAMTKLEEELGFSRGSIGKMRTGKTTSANRIAKIAEYFGVSVEYLMTGEGKEEPKEYYVDKDAADIAQEIFENPYMRTLFHAARGIEPRRLQLVTNILLDFKETNPNG